MHELLSATKNAFDILSFPIKLPSSFIKRFVSAGLLPILLLHILFICSDARSNKDIVID